MHNHLFEPGKNALTIVFKKMLLPVILLVLSTGFAEASLTFGVTFGTPQEPGHGVCVGKGVCKESFEMAPNTNLYTGNPEAVTVTFQLSPNDAGVLMMSFSLSELAQKQPDQMQYFARTASTVNESVNEPASYSFDAAYSLAGSTYESLNLLPGARILPDTRSIVQISGDFVTISFYYAHD